MEKATGTGRRMATFVSNRVETVNDEVKGDSQVQLQSPALSESSPTCRICLTVNNILHDQPALLFTVILSGTLG